MPWFQSFLDGFLHNFVYAKLATSSIRVKQTYALLLKLLFKRVCFILIVRSNFSLQVKLENIDVENIIDGNSKKTLNTGAFD